MPKTRKQKEESVQKLTEKLLVAKSVVFSDFKGLTMAQLSEIRTELRKQNAELSVTKNNLLKIALKNAHLEVTEGVSLAGPTATLMSFEDEIAPIKIVAKAIKETKVGSIKGGFLGQEFLIASKIIQLSTLPSKDELRGKVVNVLGSPLYGIVSVLQANLRNLVYVLDAVRKQREV